MPVYTYAVALACLVLLGYIMTSCSDIRKHISISILWGYPYLIGLYYKGVYMGYPYPIFCLCALLGPYSRFFSHQWRCSEYRNLGFRVPYFNTLFLKKPL